MMARLMVAMVAVLLLGGFAANVAPRIDTVQTVEAKKSKKDRNQDRREKRERREDRREKRMERREVMAFSYINPDTGLPTENPNVDEESECETPDQSDTQMVSPAASTANNVHNDACLFKKGQPVDTAVSFELSAGSVGMFSACPDPDGAGPKTMVNSGTRCYLTGYQDSNGAMAGDEEYHARINSQVAGESTVTFCADPNNNGCGDAQEKERITILWQS